MHTDSAKTFWKSVWVMIGMAAMNAVAAPDAPEDFQAVDGVAIYLGVMPAQIVRGHASEHEESKMHGGVPAGRFRNHLVAALFDDATGRRIEDAQVTAAVSELGFGPEWKALEPMRIADSVTYGNYFDMPDAGLYHIQLQIRLPQHPQPVEATFTHRHFKQ